MKLDNFAVLNIMRGAPLYQANSVMSWDALMQMAARASEEEVRLRLKNQLAHMVAHEVATAVLNHAEFTYERGLEGAAMRVKAIVLTQDRLYDLMCDAFNAGMNARPSLIMMPSGTVPL